MLGVMIFDFFLTAEGAEGAEEEKRENYGENIK
jgi:hypothetical protein